MPVPLTVPGVIDEYIPARHVWPRSVTDIRHFGLHTPEGPEMPRYARNLGNYFANLGPDRVASTHFGCDNVLTVRYARDDQTCAAARGINTSGIHIEIAGVAAQTVEQWADPFSVAALQRAANVFKLYGPGTDANIPARILTAPELARGLSGIVKHATAWAVHGGDFRSDPGLGFPDEVFLAMCRGEETTEKEEDVDIIDFIERGWRRDDADRQAVAMLDKLGYKPGSQGARLGSALAAYKTARLPGGDNDGVLRGPVWRALIADTTAACPQATVVNIPGDCGAVEAELAKARGLVATQSTMIANARNALG